jgi:hypothetical protein
MSVSRSTPTTREGKSSARMQDDDVHKPCDRMQFIPRASLPSFCRTKEQSSENIIADVSRVLEIKDKDKEDIIAEDLKNAEAILNAARIDNLKFDRTDECSSDEESLDEKLPYSRLIISRSSLPSNFRMPQNEQQAQQRRSSEKLLDNMDCLRQMIYASRNSFSYDKKSDDESSVESDYSSDQES